MCSQKVPARPQETVANCPACGSDVDPLGYSTQKGCSSGTVLCQRCGENPCAFLCV